MKKLLLSITVFGAFVSANAQSSTMDFETWTQMNNGTLPVPEEPTLWFSGNQLCSAISPGNSPSVFKVTGAEAHGGTYAMKIVTVDVVNDPSGGLLPDPVGIASAGKIQISPLKLIDGLGYTTRFTTCNFWYKYSPQAGDSASCGLVLTKWNGSKRDTIAVGGVVIKNAAASYVQTSCNMVYNPLFAAVLPDSLHIGFSATCLKTKSCGKINSTLWIDDITFSGLNGITEQVSSSDVIVFPNPASNHVTVIADLMEAFAVIAYDATGRMISSVSLNQTTSGINRKEGTISTSGLSSGLYVYSIMDKNGNSLRTGKFSVVK